MADKIPILFIGAVYNLEITDYLEGLQIWDKLHFSNDKYLASDLLDEDLIPVIGRLEYKALIGGKPFFYAVDYKEVNSHNEENTLADYLATSQLFLHHLWKLKDHSSNMMMSYLIYPFSGKKGGVYLSSGNPTIHSNCLSTNHTKANGIDKIQTKFSKSELVKCFNRLQEDNLIRVPLSELNLKPSLLVINRGRGSRAEIFIQLARTTHDLAIKISMYCTALESLFSTDNSELAHKLSVRVSFFLESDPRKRRAIYQKVKDIYGIRSKVVHGDSLTKQESKLKQTSIEADDLLRTIMNKIDSNEELDKFFRRTDTGKEFQEYLSNLEFGNV